MDLWFLAGFGKLRIHAALPIYICIYDSMAYRHMRLCSVIQVRACQLSLAPHQLPACDAQLYGCRQLHTYV